MKLLFRGKYLVLNKFNMLNRNTTMEKKSHRLRKHMCVQRLRLIGIDCALTTNDEKVRHRLLL